MRILDPTLRACRPDGGAGPRPRAWPARRSDSSQRQDPRHGVPRARGRAPARAPRRGGAGARLQGESSAPAQAEDYARLAAQCAVVRHRHRRLRELLVGQCADAITLEKHGSPPSPS